MPNFDPCIKTELERLLRETMSGENRHLVTSQPIEIRNCLIEFKIFENQLIVLGENERIFFIFLRLVAKRMLQKISWSKKM